MRILHLVFLVSALAACGSSPVAPTPPPTTETTPVIGNLSGTWTGEYAITGCSPTNAPNQCSWYIPPGSESMTLTLEQSGTTLSGMFTSARIGGPLPVSGSVDAAGVVRLTGARPSGFQCFAPNSVRAIEVGDWHTEITKTGELSGTFRQSSEQILSSCYTGRYDYRTEILSLKRTGAPAVTLPPVSPPATGIHVSGRVLDFRTGAPVPAVPMTWLGRTEAYGVVGSVTATSDPQGRYSLVLPPAAYYALTLGDSSSGASGVVRVAATIYQTDLLVAGDACNWVRYGTIVDATTRAPIAGAQVSASGRSAITRDDGTYTLDRGCLSAGASPTNLVVNHAGYASQSQFFFGNDAITGVERMDFALASR
jgi:hypothetical protein